MTATEAAQLFEQGEFLKIAQALRDKSHKADLERAILAWCEFELGDAEKAQADCRAVIAQSKDPSTQAFALMATGLAVGRQGSPEKAIPLLRKAIAIAADCNPHLQATLLGRYCGALLSWIGLEPVLQELPKLRQLALHVGNVRALAAYHIASARVAASRGHQDAAVAELRLAANLLERYPDAHQSSILLQTRASVALMDSNVDEARRCMQLCLDQARLSGNKGHLAYTLGNLANILAIAGEFDKARSFIEQSDQVLAPFNRARFALWNIGISIALSTNDLPFGESMIRKGEAALKRIGPSQSYYHVWFDLYRVKWLLALKRPEDALDLAVRGKTDAKRFADNELRNRFAMFLAEAEFMRSNVAKAEQLLGEACREIEHPSLETLAEFLRISALVCSERDRSKSAMCIKTAFRILTCAGLHGVRFEVERTAALLGIDLQHSDSECLGSSALAALGIILRLGRHPTVLGRELVAFYRTQVPGYDVLLEERSGQTSRVIDSTLTDRSSQNGSTHEPLFLGEGASSSYWLHSCQPLDGPTRVLWTAAEQLVAAARALRFNSKRTDGSERPAVPAIQFEMVTAGDATSKVLDTVRKLGPSSITVLITGETGTGKELLARAVHQTSNRTAKPFIPFNCGSIPRDIVESQLFGHRRGAFTGALEASQGVIRAAAGGTLFLDEIGEMSLDLQPKLLRFLESGEIHPLGEPRPIQVDVRVIAATNADLEKLVSEGRFREDLFYRLNVVRLEIPPLRERREEIPPLVHYFIDRHSREEQKTGIRVADETMEYLILYNWPGNVRQLANELRRIVTLAESNAVLMPEHLSHRIAASRRTVPVSERPLAPTEFVVRMDQPMSAAVEHVERSMIQYALKQSGGRVEDAAHRLGLSRKGLYLKRQRLHIDLPDEHPAVNQ